MHFADEVDFDNAAFTSANFRGTRFGGVTDFSGAAFADEVHFAAEAVGDDAYVDFTDAVLKEGLISQPAEHWVRYDFTQASLGDLRLEAERPGGTREILDYFRFCNTEFNEFDGHAFDFSAHTYYFDRNDWNLHAFEAASTDREYALEMTPENVETTYLKAKQAASAGGYVKAAGEFRVQRQRYARRKHLSIARDAAADLRTRLANASRAIENYFLDVTCGYGMRLGRILVVFLVAPLVPGLLYAFGGPAFRTGAGQLSSLGVLATPEARAVLFKNLYFSYITFLTIGYGGIGPKGVLARMLAGLEVYLSVVLGGLVLYALIKRSEL
ncbi:MAG: ion channel [Halobacteriales archaeon]